MSQLLKKKLMLVFISFTILVAFVGFLAANRSLAWFANNNNVLANGISVNAKVSPNLIIAKSEDDLTNGNFGFSVDMNSTDNTNMIAITLNKETLKYLYVEDTFNVDPVTGFEKPGEKLNLVEIPADGDGIYYIDYTVYIAATEGPLNVSSLKATITIPEAVDPEYNYFMAASVDFYVGSVSDTGYRGTTSVSESQSGGAGVDIFTDVSGTVPFYEDDCIPVIMRLYFDGALPGKDGNAYVNSYTVKTLGVVIGVMFSADEGD